MVVLPRPVRLAGRTTTLRDAMRPGASAAAGRFFWLCISLCNACRDAQLNASEPQNRIRSGSWGGERGVDDDDDKPRTRWRAYMATAAARLAARQDSPMQRLMSGSLERLNSGRHRIGAAIMCKSRLPLHPAAPVRIDKCRLGPYSVLRP